MNGDGLLQVIQVRPMSQPKPLDHRQHPFREAASRLAVATECVLPPGHPAAKVPLGTIVRRLDPLTPCEKPQRRTTNVEIWKVDMPDGVCINGTGAWIKVCEQLGLEPRRLPTAA
jgi:hypothetical protein